LEARRNSPWVCQDLHLKEKRGPVYNCFGFNHEPEESIRLRRVEDPLTGRSADPAEVGHCVESAQGRNIMHSDHSESTRRFRNPGRIEDFWVQQGKVSHEKEVVAFSVAASML
jgi:hypothetical protein